MMAVLTAGVALVLAIAALAAAVRALTARALFTVSVSLAASAAAGAGAMLALGGANGALLLALFGVGLAPVLLLAGALLSAPTARATRAGAPWLTLLAAAIPVAVLFWAAPTRAQSALTASADIGPWLAMLVFVGAAACVALLGYGERGALERPGPRP